MTSQQLTALAKANGMQRAAEQKAKQRNELNVTSLSIISYWNWKTVHNSHHQMPHLCKYFKLYVLDDAHEFCKIFYWSIITCYVTAVSDSKFMLLTVFV